MKRIVPSILGWLVVLLVLAMAPNIATYNGYIAANISHATNNATMLAMDVVTDFGGFLMIMSMLAGTVLFALAGRMAKNYTVADMVEVIALVIITLVAEQIYAGSLVGYFDALITAGAAGFEQTAYGLFPIVTYLALVSAAGAFAGYKAYRSRRAAKGRPLRGMGRYI